MFSKGAAITFAELNTKRGDFMRIEDLIGSADEYLLFI